MTMVRLKRGFFLFLLLTLSALTGEQSVLKAEPASHCYDDWSVGTALVKKHGLVSVEQLRSRAKKELSGHFVKTTLCRTKDGYAYLVVIRKDSGQLETVTIDALDGSVAEQISR